MHPHPPPRAHRCCRYQGQAAALGIETECFTVSLRATSGLLWSTGWVCGFPFLQQERHDHEQEPRTKELRALEGEKGGSKSACYYLPSTRESLWQKMLEEEEERSSEPPFQPPGRQRTLHPTLHVNLLSLPFTDFEELPSESNRAPVARNRKLCYGNVLEGYWGAQSLWEDRKNTWKVGSKGVLEAGQWGPFGCITSATTVSEHSGGSKNPMPTHSTCPVHLH